MTSKAKIALLLLARCSGWSTVTFAAYERQREITPLAASRMNFSQRTGPLVPAGPISPVNNDSGEHSAAFGDLAVRVAGVEVTPITDAPESRRISVSVIVNNTGNNAACATFTSRLKTTSGMEYRGAVIQAPSMSEMLPGSRAHGNYIFEVKEGDQPLQLILNLNGGTIRCGSPGDEPVRDGSLPIEIRLDVYNLVGLRANALERRALVRPPTTSGGTPNYATCIYCPTPHYTDKARHAKLEGTVLLQVVVQSDGNPGNIEILKGIGLGLDEEAVNAVRDWRFKPATRPNGDPIQTVVPIEIGFRLPR